ncbi:TraR/DksA family transcriptional regulator [Kosakonia oryziphila]|uniref:Transcriptional regulator, TraR/DksA family n=1 Tax=Kosakonia oryziphila TaxID=1005667 RepID=A0A1C4DUW8_9ENTR|nr:TraR/DksA family transcriptional regulator [Kosakonia oryziphila]SCC35158.1 transcriptional regulator, TraR/DksA family [Kosakonia oryziphila]
MPSEIIDQANELVEQNINNAIQAHRINRNAVSAEYCEECGEDIPQARRIAVPGCQTCAECQGIIELKRKQRGM